MLYKEAVALFSQYLKSEKMRSPETCRAYRADLEDFQGFVAGVDPRALSDVSRIDPLLIREFLADRFLHLTKESLARKVACIRSFFKFLVREGIVQNNPAAAIRAPKRSRPLPRALSVDDMDRFFRRNSGMSKRDAAIFELLYSSGLRVGELTSLKLQDIDLENGWVRVMGKGRKERYVPIGSRATAAVEAYLSVRLAGRSGASAKTYTDRLFLNARGG
ncbi:MAG: tyrosine-type recombinase/integrase, partial [Desulfomonilaceae bacterium]